MKRLKVDIVLVFIGLFAFSCAYNASFVKTSYNILAVSQASYDTSMKIVADLYKRGELPEENKTKILVVATTYYQAHNAAVKALAKYEETKSFTDQQLLEKQIALVSEAIADLLTIIRPYLEV